MQFDEAISRYSEILDDPALARANVFTLIFSGSKIIAAISEAGSVSRNRLIEKSRTALGRIAADDSVYKRERIYSAIGKIDLERIDNEQAELSADLREEILKLAAWADESTPDVYERQPIINAASGLLEYAGMPNVARPLLLAELERSKQPYYFMLSLADIEQTSGNYALALEWLRKAYATSKGSATRFQWGYYYVVGLMEMSPEDGDLIHKTTIDVIKELEGGAGFHQRPKSQLQRLESKLKEWNEGASNASTLEAIRNDVLAICNRFADQQDPGSTCRSFLDSV
jgi:protein disulfide-isomerase